MSLHDVLAALKAKGCKIAHSPIPGHIMVDGLHLTADELRKP